VVERVLVDLVEALPQGHGEIDEAAEVDGGVAGQRVGFRGVEPRDGHVGRGGAHHLDLLDRDETLVVEEVVEVRCNRQVESERDAGLLTDYLVEESETLDALVFSVELGEVGDGGEEDADGVAGLGEQLLRDSAEMSQIDGSFYLVLVVAAQEVSRDVLRKNVDQELHVGVSGRLHALQLEFGFLHPQEVQTRGHLHESCVVANDEEKRDQNHGKLDGQADTAKKKETLAELTPRTYSSA
jgi:hypothetical protein